MVNGSLTSSAEERSAWLAIKHCCPRPTLTEAAGLATDAELCVQLGHGKAPAAGEDNESIDLFHEAYVGPGHRPKCNQSPRIKCHLSRRIAPLHSAGRNSGRKSDLKKSRVQCIRIPRPPVFQIESADSPAAHQINHPRSYESAPPPWLLRPHPGRHSRHGPD
jgi:hypothetical protein